MPKPSKLPAPYARMQAAIDALFKTKDAATIDELLPSVAQERFIATAMGNKPSALLSLMGALLHDLRAAGPLLRRSLETALTTGAVVEPDAAIESALRITSFSIRTRPQPKRKKPKRAR